MQSDLAWNVLESLTTEVGPRMVGSAGDARAVTWGVKKFRQLGFDKVWTKAVTVPVWKRIHEKVEIVGQYAQPLTVAALGYSIATPNGGLQAEIIEFATYEDLVTSPAHSADGKIVYISHKMERHSSGRGYGKSGPARFMGPVEAGMPAMVLVQDHAVYFDLHQTANDTLNKVVPDELAQNVAAWAIFVKIAADWEGRFDRQIHSRKDKAFTINAFFIA